MKLRVTIEGKTYDVEVEPGDPAPAADRVQGSPVGTPPPRPNGFKHQSKAPAASTASPAQPEPPPPAVVRPPWHGLTVGGQGECVSPVPGKVMVVLVKVGDAVKPGDALLEIELSSVIAPAETPIGTIRAVEAGTVADVCVRPGDMIRFGQMLVRLQQPAPTS